jgi:hypothetical protein
VCSKGTPFLGAGNIRREEELLLVTKHKSSNAELLTAEQEQHAFDTSSSESEQPTPFKGVFFLSASQRCFVTSSV